MDDDDLFYPTHFKQVSSLARSALRKNPTQVSAIGLYRQHLASVSADGVSVVNVDFSRCIPGNKFYVIPRSHFSKASEYSPWGIPELVDEEAVERFIKNNIHFLKAVFG